MANLRYGPKHVVVVDDDINVHDPVDVEWALATRMQASKDVVILSKPVTAAGDAFGWPKMGIDATVPLKDKKWYQRTKVPGLEKVDYV